VTLTHARTRVASSAGHTPRGAVLLTLAALTLAGCGSTTSSSLGAQVARAPDTAAGTTLLVAGPGPQRHYSVQPQPQPGTCHYRQEGRYPLPDPACTPGAVNPQVTQDNLASTICRSGFTSQIRPPSSVTGHEKVANALAYGYTGSTRTGEYDHLISLELGGDPNDPRNLWVEPNDRSGATGTTNSKDGVENAAHTAICHGRLTLREAQAGIASDWVALGHRLGIDLP